MNSSINSDVLQDISPTGRVQPWKEHKMSNELLSLAYSEVDPAKAERLRECASQISFNILSDGSKKLRTANFCRVRLCPMCAWRRGLKVFAHTKAILDSIAEEKEMAYIFVTLTVKNVQGEQLGASLDDLMQGWQRLIQSKRVKTAVKGFYRGLEVTHNVDPKSKEYDTFHPHFHCIFAVNTSYFKKSDYLTHAEWTSLWERAMRLDYTPIVDVRKVTGNTAEAVSEVAKYAVKADDYIVPDDWDLTVETVALLDKVLANRRFVAYGGLLKEWHKKLNLDDEQNGDLVNLEGKEEQEESVKKVWYSWNTGYKQYMRG